MSCVLSYVMRRVMRGVILCVMSCVKRHVMHCVMHQVMRHMLQQGPLTSHPFNTGSSSPTAHLSTPRTSVNAYLDTALHQTVHKVEEVEPAVGDIEEHPLICIDAFAASLVRRLPGEHLLLL